MYKAHVCDVHHFELGLWHFKISVFSKIIVNTFGLKVLQQNFTCVSRFFHTCC